MGPRSVPEGGELGPEDLLVDRISELPDDGERYIHGDRREASGSSPLDSMSRIPRVPSVSTRVSNSLQLQPKPWNRNTFALFMPTLSTQSGTT